ncbi:hypothetical protein C8J57DRAFT_1530242 [Mycena rebaudengoi]|nr:hypothetical protein C8J57DRAFT_1530242 [Mycena rebaudengoi]
MPSSSPTPSHPATHSRESTPASSLTSGAPAIVTLLSGTQDVDWQDEDDNPDAERLPGLGVSSHRSQNPQYPVIPVQKCAKRPQGPNAHATAKKRCAATAKNSAALAADIAILNAERESCAQELADTHNIKIKEVRQRILASSSLPKRRAPNLWNTKMSAVAKRLNADHETGDCYLPAEIRDMVRKDPKLAELTAQEEAQLRVELEVKREQKQRGVRATNVAAAKDAARTMKALMVEAWWALRCSLAGIFTTPLCAHRMHYSKTISKSLLCLSSTAFPL